MSNIGIYKITSPSNKIYIGQSINLAQRFYKYKSMHCEVQKKLFASIMKYGWLNHKTEIIHELPIDVSPDILNTYEVLYMELYKNCGVNLMNVKGGGSNGRHSELTKKSMRESAIKRGNNLPEGYKHSDETRNKLSISHKGKPSNKKGILASKETKHKQSLAKLGRTGINCPNSKKVICSMSGIVYNCVGEAAAAIGIKRTTLNSYLVGQNKNVTTLKYFING